MSEHELRSVELFSGCGGLALGLSRAGFAHDAMVEFNSCAVATILHNKQRKISHVEHWPIELRDVREVDWREFEGIDLVAGGPPCQPFSIGGKAKGDQDTRDMWPQAIRAVREIGPAGFVFENVRGLLRPKFGPYLTSIVSRLSNPRPGLHYNVRVQLVNAADFGAAQKRHRVLIVGFRDGEPWPGFKPTHSRERLIWDQWVSGDYWRDHNIEQDLDRFPVADAALVRKLRACAQPPSTERWVTVRDRLKGLGDPNDYNNHVFQPGARSYPGHTGSPQDQPSKALKAGDHGVPGGENMLVNDDCQVRYFTLREAARLQGLPDDYQFPRSWSESMRQLGNAVPVELASNIGQEIFKRLSQLKAEVAIAA